MENQVAVDYIISPLDARLMVERPSNLPASQPWVVLHFHALERTTMMDEFGARQFTPDLDESLDELMDLYRSSRMGDLLSGLGFFMADGVYCLEASYMRDLMNMVMTIVDTIGVIELMRVELTGSLPYMIGELPGTASMQEAWLRQHPESD